MTGEVVLLLGWATLVGVDLVAFPQFMVARPLVAGTVAGAIAGDPASGALVGAVLELFALDVLPVGAVRYPDYGVGAVAAAVTAAGAPGVLGLGVGVAAGLVVAWLGEWSIVGVRRVVSARVKRVRGRLDAGERRAVAGTQLFGLAADTARALLLGGVGLLIAEALRRAPPVTLRGAILLGLMVTGVGLGVATGGALRLAGRARGVGWFAAGLLGGTVWMVVR